MTQDIYMDKEVGHFCLDKPEEEDVREPVQPYVLGNFKLAYYLN